ncbi:MAG: xanthine dehydrogenase family protein molybdopterin-binding subunit [Acidobacteriota bacterium]|nr:xanthine dehydrogenase family protein molybdopterin-binding subunit [Acidobacteriota bacterium]
MNKRKTLTGEAVNRIDGILKVTGAAPYATDFPVKNVATGFLIKSETAAGKILEIDQTAAEKAPGVLAVVTHKNALKLASARSVRGGAMLQTPDVIFWGENIGVVIAETFEQARYAASLIKVNYQKSAPKVDFDAEKNKAATPKLEDRQDVTRGGDVEKAFVEAEFKVDAVYETPIEHHHPMAPHATIAVWETDDKLTLYNESQVVNGVQNAVASAFGLKPENVRVVTPHIGGGFGSKGGAWGHVAVAAMAAKIVKRPVKLVLTRQMMFNSVGLRQRDEQHVRLGATKDGILTAINHETTTHCAINAEFAEPCGDVSAHMYEAAARRIAYRVAPMNVILPTFNRAPGKSTGSFALESAIDELAFKLKIDPVELRIKNEPAKDPLTGKPWSSRSLVQALRAGAEKFGWKNRKPEPRQNKQGEYWVGYGVGCGIYQARQRDTSAIVKLTRNGKDVSASIELAASDLGTGTHTILAQIAADSLGLPLDKVGVKLGDSSLPPAAGSVGSVGAASFANAVNDACRKITDELVAKSGKVFEIRPTAAELMVSENIPEFQTRMDAKPLPEAEKYASHSFNANFAEVWVNDLTGMVRVKRFVTATGAGRILNPKTADSQMIGGVIWGIGQALHEESILDPRWGNFVTRTFADYHIPVNLDVPEIETIFVREEDPYVNKMGIKGIGEVGIVGVAGAIANAIFNATGKRVRSLPITPDKLL